jgi:hypothetical protein
VYSLYFFHFVKEQFQLKKPEANPVYLGSTRFASGFFSSKIAIPQGDSDFLSF